MAEDSDTTFTDDVARAIARLDPELEKRLGKDPQAHLDLVALTSRARDEISELLGAAVASARAAGASWESIGSTLGMSRQAAQQRFGRGSDVTAAGTARRLVGLTAFSEMDALEDWGRHGWHSVNFGPLFHDVEPSDVQWQHRRAVVGGRAARDLERSEDWERIGGSWFPWVYFARPTELPAEPGEPE